MGNMNDMPTMRQLCVTSLWTLCRKESWTSRFSSCLSSAIRAEVASSTFWEEQKQQGYKCNLFSQAAAKCLYSKLQIDFSLCHTGRRASISYSDFFLVSRASLYLAFSVSNWPNIAALAAKDRSCTAHRYNCQTPVESKNSATPLR